MKDNLDIEKLFQEKLGSLEGDVSPNLWNNISQNIGANAGAGAAAKTGMSLMLKKVLIGTGIVAAGITGVYIATNSGETPTEENNTEIAQNITEDNNTNNTVELNTNGNEESAQDNNSVVFENEVNSDNSNVNESNSESSNSNESNSDNSSNSSNSEGNNSESTQTNNENNSSSEENNASNSNENTSSNNNSNSSSNDDSENENNTDNSEVLVPTGNMEYTATSFSIPSEVMFTANAKNASSIVWNFGDGESAQGENVSHVYSQPGEYAVTLTVFGEDDLNYTESQKINITTKSSIDNIPNVFTPDGDRINDLFSIKTTELKTFYMVIYDIKGNKVFETQDADFIWDGTDLGGNMVDKGIYTYMIKAEGNDGALFSIPGEVQVR